MRNVILITILGVFLVSCSINNDEETSSSTEQVELISKSLIKSKSVNPKKGKHEYACTISTLASEDYAHNYWNKSYWIKFPKKAVEDAKGKKSSKYLFTVIKMPVPKQKNGKA